MFSAIIRKTKNTMYLVGALLIRLIASPFVKIVRIWKCIGQLANISLRSETLYWRIGDKQVLLYVWMFYNLSKKFCQCIFFCFLVDIIKKICMTIHVGHNVNQTNNSYGSMQHIPLYLPC